MKRTNIYSLIKEKEIDPRKEISRLYMYYFDGRNNTLVRCVIDILEEIDKMHGIGWVTNGREIENYIPVEALRTLFNNPDLPQMEKFDSFAEYLKQHISEGESKKFLKDKIVFAEAITKYFTKEMLQQSLDLNDKINLSIEQIKKWNHL